MSIPKPNNPKGRPARLAEKISDIRNGTPETLN
jgi:hypothetical protein